jgi:hypothetical protein
MCSAYAMCVRPRVLGPSTHPSPGTGAIGGPRGGFFVPINLISGSRGPNFFSMGHPAGPHQTASRGREAAGLAAG